MRRVAQTIRKGGAVIESIFLSLLTIVCAATEPATAPASTRPAADTRPRLAIVDFEPAPDSDSRDAWVPVAIEELLCRRLQRVPDLLVVPTVRLYQARNELAEPNTVPPWPDVVRGLGASYLLTGRCRGPDNAVSVELNLQRVDDPTFVEQRVTLPAGRVFAALDDVTRWTLERLKLLPLPDAVAGPVFAPPCESPLPVEYYARAVAAVRADKPREALRYATESQACDWRFRPALLLLAQVEAQFGPSGRDSAARRLRGLSDLARMDADPFDRVRAELGQSLLLQVDGGFEAACTRAETALAMAYELRDVYGQMAAITALCDVYLLQPLPETLPSSAEARLTFARNSTARAAEWQNVLLDMLEGLGDRLAGLPAANKLALIYERLGQSEAAFDVHKRTLAMATALGSRRHEATAWLYLGQWYRGQQRWPEALDAMSRCLTLADESSKPGVRVALGEVYQGMNLPEEALAQYELAYEQVRKTDDLSNQFTCLREIASARMKLGRRDKAIAALQEAIDIAHALELRDEQRLREQLETWKAGGT